MKYSIMVYIVVVLLVAAVVSSQEEDDEYPTVTKVADKRAGSNLSYGNALASVFYHLPSLTGIGSFSPYGYLGPLLSQFPGSYFPPSGSFYH